MRILFIGDIVGSPGREIVTNRFPENGPRERVDLVIINGENSAAGFGITPKIADELFALGADVITGGNHSWDRKEILEFIPNEPRLLRPANFPKSPGRGLYVGTSRGGVRYAVLNLQGRVFMTQLDCPFRTADAELARIPPDEKNSVVDIHAEASRSEEHTSELQSL